MKTNRMIIVGLAWAVFAVGLTGFGKEAATSRPAQNEKQMWKAVEEAEEALGAFKEGNGPLSGEEVRAAGRTLAEKVKAYLQQFPDGGTGVDLKELRWMVSDGLTAAMEAGDAAAEEELVKYIEEIISNAGLGEDERANYVQHRAMIPILKKAGLKAFRGDFSRVKTEHNAATLAGIQGALKLFPKQLEHLYPELLWHAQRSEGDAAKELASQLVSAPRVPPQVKAIAQDILDGKKKAFALDKPLDLKFTALDGRAVDLASLKGKVVLIDFWATWCGPCVAEIPNVKKAYEKYHDEGFEVVGISLDEEKKDLEKFIKDKKLPWPQYFDGKGFESEYALRFQVDAIPTMWLVDRQGNLCDLDACDGLARKIARLLPDTNNPAKAPVKAGTNRSSREQARSPLQPLLTNDKEISERLTREGARLLDSGNATKMSVLQEQLSRSRCHLALPRAVAKPRTSEQLFAQNKASVVVLASLYKCDKCSLWHYTSATGFFVTESGALATCYHVLEDEGDAPKSALLFATTSDGKIYSIKEVLAADKENDVVLLQVDGKGFTPVPLAIKPPGVGAPVRVIGHPNEQFYSITEGIISRYFVSQEEGDASREYMSITAEFAKGSSGAPAFDQNGAVIGVCAETSSIYYDETEDSHDNLQMVLKLCIPVQKILDLIEPK